VPPRDPAQQLIGLRRHPCDQRLQGGHVLDYTLTDATVRIDEAAELTSSFPPRPILQIVAGWLTSRLCDGLKPARPLGTLRRFGAASGCG
jgi:hypothetical protein